MADELDKFVLVYEVVSNKASDMLDKLNKKVKQNNESFDDSKNKAKEFANEAADEIGKLVPGVDKVSAAVKLMSAEFAAAGVALGVLAFGVKAVMQMRDQYNAQRKQGIGVGLSAIQLEDNERKLVKSGGGNVTTAMADDALKRIAEINSESFKNPTGDIAKNLRYRGLEARAVGDPRGAMTTLERAQELQNRWRGRSEGQVRAEARSLGFDSDTAVAIKNSKDVSQITEHSADEVNNRLKANETLKEFNDSTARLSEHFRELTNEVGEHLLPAFTRMANFLTGWMDGLPKKYDQIKKDLDKGQHINQLTPEEREATKDTSPGVTGWLRRTLGISDPNKKLALDQDKDANNTGSENDRETKAFIAKQDGAADKNMKAAQQAVDAQNKEAADSQRQLDQEQAIISMFSAAVTTFSGAVDINQAIAAWAGTVGKASGLAGASPGTAASGDRPGIIKTPQGPVADLSKYDKFIQDAAKQTGLDPSLIKGVINTESRGRAKAESEAGARGLMQVMPSNLKRLGVTDDFDPQQNIMAGAKVLAEFMRMAKGDVQKALTFYTGGLKPENYGPRTRAYPGKVLGAQAAYEGVGSARAAPVANDPRFSGQSRDSLNYKSIQNQFAAGLGLPVAQIQQGGVSRGDMQREYEVLSAGLRNRLAELKQSSFNPNLSVGESAAIIRETQQQARQIQYLEKYGPDVVSRAPEGARSRTLGAFAPGSEADKLPLTINVYGQNDPKATADEVVKHLQLHISDVQNGSATSIVK